jgi:hypothetical protein
MAKLRKSACMSRLGAHDGSDPPMNVLQGQRHRRMRRAATLRYQYPAHGTFTASTLREERRGGFFFKIP